MTESSTELIVSSDALESIGLPSCLSGVTADEIERMMIAANCPLADDVVEYRHLIGNGVYYREMMAKAGTMIVGARHKGASLSIILRGSILLYKDGDVVRIDAPYTFLANPGARRVGYVIEDLSWVNVFPHEDGQTPDDVINKHCEFTADFVDYAMKVIEDKRFKQIKE